MSRALPQVSVMMPARDAEETIAAALSTILADPGVDVEVIVVDDASSDRTADVVAAFDDERIMLVTGPGAGVNAARNVALTAMTGEWLTLLDADDQWLPGRLETLIEQAESWDVPLIADDVVVENVDTGASSSLLDSRGLLAPCDITAAEFARRELGWLKPLVRTDVIADQEFPAHIRKAGDFHFWFRAIKRAGGLRLAPQTGYRYRYRQAESVSVDSPELWLQVVIGSAELLEQDGLTDAERSALERRLWLAWGRYHRETARHAFRAGGVAQSLRRPLTKPSMLGERIRAAGAHLAWWAQRQPAMARARQ